MNNEISKVTALSFPPLARNLGNAQKSKTSVAEEAKVDKKAAENVDKNKSEAKVTSLDEARKLVDEGNKILDNVQRNLQFKVDDSTKQVVMSIVDKKTGEVIRQIPSEEVLELAHRMQELDGEPGGIMQGKV